MTTDKPQDSAAPMCAASALSAGLGAKVGDGDTAAVGHDGKTWPQTMDAKVWADEFCKRNSASDHGTMLGWFANAIMIGYDTARWEFEDAQEATIYLTPAELAEKQAVLNSAVRSMLDNVATPNAIAQGREHSERPAGAEGYTS